MNWAIRRGYEFLSGYATDEERDREEHFRQFLEGDIPHCRCGWCLYWIEQQRRDSENE